MLHPLLPISRRFPAAVAVLLSVVALALVVPDRVAGHSVAPITGLRSATAMAFAPDGRLFILEQAGRVRVVKDGNLLPEPFLTVEVDGNGERGLLGIAFDPDFLSNNFVYLYRTVPGSPPRNQVFRVTANGDRALAGSEQVIFDLDPLSSAANHNGGSIRFLPDGTLLVAVGDNADGRKAQALDTTHGKVLRIRKDGSIPDDNPLVGRTQGKYRAIWAWGLRNPFSLAVYPVTGQVMVNDVGESDWEEVNEGRPGANYGWPSQEGAGSDARFVNPVHAYSHGQGCAIVGGTFLPAGFVLGQGLAYAFGDYCQGWVRALDLGTGRVASVATELDDLVALETGPDGRLYVLQRSRLSHIDPASGVVPASPSPRPLASPSPSPWLSVSPSPSPIAVARVSIERPLADQRYRAGDVIAFSGSVRQADGSFVAASELEWQVDFHHDDHLHPFLAATRGMAEGSVTIPTRGETSANVWYRFILRGPGGLQAYRDVFPQVSRLTLRSQPTLPGAVTIDGRPVPTAGVAGVTGVVRTIEAAEQVVVGNVPYAFDAWEHGGGRVQEYSFPERDTTLVARYRPILVPDATCAARPGDTTCDGMVNMADVAALADIVALKWDPQREDILNNADVTGDGRIGLADLVAVARSVAGLP